MPQYNKRDLENLIPVETFNSLLNPLKLPYIESSAINGTGVFETLKEIAKLTIPYVKEKVFGEKREEQTEQDKAQIQQIVEQAAQDRGKIIEEIKPEKKEEPVRKQVIGFTPKREEHPIRMTKIRFKNQFDVDAEVENLAKEFIGSE